jgi:ArsR family transcriptional regulator
MNMVATFPKMQADQTYAIARALADPYRFAILQQIASNANLPTSKLYAHDPFRPATIAHHIRELREAGLIEIANAGPHPSYRLARHVWRAYLDELARFIGD